MSTNKYLTQYKKKFSNILPSIIRHEDNIDKIVKEFMSSTNRSQAYWKAINTSLNTEYKAINKIFSEWSYNEIPKELRFVAREQMAYIKSLKSVTKEAQMSLKKMLNTHDFKNAGVNLAQTAIDDLTGAMAQGRVQLNRLIAKKKQSLIDAETIGYNTQGEQLDVVKDLFTRDEVAKALKKTADEKKFIKIIDKNGNPRNYQIRYYSDLVARTQYHKAQAEAVKQVNKNYDNDLIRVSTHNTTTEICQAYEGKIFSLSGVSKMFPVADNVPPYHPNCIHFITPVFEESLQIQGTLQEFSDFSNNRTNKPPVPAGYVPLDVRNKAVNSAIQNTKKSEVFKEATKAGKKNLLNKNVTQAIRDAA